MWVAMSDATMVERLAGGSADRLAEMMVDSSVVRKVDKKVACLAALRVEQMAETRVVSKVVQKADM
jgi:hypothetical protein